MLILAAASTVFVLDLTTKHAVRRLPAAPIAVVPGLKIRRVQFADAMFARPRGRAGLVLTWLIALACAIALTVSNHAFHTAAAQAGVGAALGGALGNLVDVLRRSAITDFVDLGWWPVFNLADVGIVGGLAIALWPMVF
jgi:signal peptidase II